MPHASEWDAVHLLAEPNRRRVYDAVRAGRQPMTRDEVASATGLGRRLATFHLDQLAEAGLLAVDYARPPGRTGPGAGRPAKRYAPTVAELAVSLPQRRYDLVARLLAAAVRDGEGGADAPGDLARRAAYDEGRRIGEQHKPGGPLSRRATLDCAQAALAELGYEPGEADAGAVRLRNCPFHTVVDVAPQLVCGMNERLVAGLLAGLDGHPAVTATLAPQPPDCCVRLTDRPPPRGG